MTESVNQTLRGTLLPPNKPPVSKNYVRSVIRRLVSVDVEIQRMHPTRVTAAKSFVKQRIRIDSVFERVEQDALHLPFVVITPSGTTSEVYLTHAIECSMSYPLGQRFTVGAPTDTDTLACAEMYMSPIKARYFKELGINHDVNLYGTPGQIYFDNGPETKRSRLMKLERLGVDIHHCRARAGQEKPFIERLNRSLKEALEGLAGCTRVDGVDGARDPIACGDVLMTIEELELWVIRWLYEKWVHTPLDRLTWDVVMSSTVKGNTPAERWKHHEASGSALLLAPSRTEWLSALYERTERRLSRKTGITIEGLHYIGDEMAALLSRYGESHVLTVLFNPDDFRYVFVYEDDDSPLIVLSHEFLRPETPAWKFSEAKEKFKDEKRRVTVAPEAEKFDSDLHAKTVVDSKTQRAKTPSKRDRNRETAKNAKKARAVERAAQPQGAVVPPHPKNPAMGLGRMNNPESGTPILTDVPLLPVFNRGSGERLT